MLILSLHLCIGAGSVLAKTPKNVDYVGSKVCNECHAPQYRLWQQSDHHKAMQVADESTVLGNFSGITVTFHQRDSKLYRKAGKFVIDTVDQHDQKRTFTIKYTFGHYPLQQYLVETEDGHIQALNIAWDSRDKQQGGQRWFHLRADDNITTEHPFFWTRHFQNWNSRCADCHSTNVTVDYDVQSNSYDTRWSQINIGCEACHGPAGQHVVNAKDNTLRADNSGFTLQLPQTLTWQFQRSAAIASTDGMQNDQHVDMCGACHSLRTRLTKNALGKRFHDANRLQLLNDGAYFIDGQIRDEAFVLGSFMQSKMYQLGVNCSNCHNPHSGKVLVEGNGLCGQCHAPAVYDSQTHHHHAPGSEGSACVNCHMPARTYMQVDDRRDHRFGIPNPDLSRLLGVPNACSNCHKNDKALQHKDVDSWASTQLKQWKLTSDNTEWAILNQRAQQSDYNVVHSISNGVFRAKWPDLIGASLLQQLVAMPSADVIAAANKALQHASPLIRRAAVEASEPYPAETRWTLLSPYLADSSLSVRVQIAQTLADVFSSLADSQRPPLAALIDEYRQVLAVSAGLVGTQVSLANLEMRLGNIEQARRAYQQALRIEPNYVPALLNLADFHRGVGEHQQATVLLERALRVAPDSGGVQHSYGLMLIRKRQYDKALHHLRQAVLQHDAQPRYAYVYAVALDNTGQTIKAIAELRDANKRWPNQYDLLLTLVLYLEKTGDIDSLVPYLQSLATLAPSSAQVRRLLAAYRR